MWFCEFNDFTFLLYSAAVAIVLSELSRQQLFHEARNSLRLFIDSSFLLYPRRPAAVANEIPGPLRIDSYLRYQLDSARLVCN